MPSLNSYICLTTTVYLEGFEDLTWGSIAGGIGSAVFHFVNLVPVFASA